MICRNFVVNTPPGQSAIVLKTLKGPNERVSLSSEERVEFSSTSPGKALLKIRLVSPRSTIRERKDGTEEIIQEELPEWIEGIVSCPNKNCITAQPKEPTHPKFRIVSLDPPTLQCYYCGRYIDYSSVVSQFS